MLLRHVRVNIIQYSYITLYSVNLCTEIMKLLIHFTDFLDGGAADRAAR